MNDNKKLNIEISETYKIFEHVVNNNTFSNNSQEYFYNLLHYNEILDLDFKLTNNNKQYTSLEMIQRIGLTLNKKITLRIYLGEIQNAKTDIIVDTLNEDLVLGSGVAHAIKVYGGPTIQQELNNIKQYMQPYYPTKKYQGLFVTNSGNLVNIKQIYHIVGPKYTDINNLELFEKKIAEITLFTLHIFNFNNQESITFPTISTGSFLGSRNNLQSALKAFIISIFYFYDYDHNIITQDKVINIVVYKNDVDQYNRIINIIKTIIKQPLQIIELTTDLKLYNDIINNFNISYANRYDYIRYNSLISLAKHKIKISQNLQDYIDIINNIKEKYDNNFIEFVQINDDDENTFNQFYLEIYLLYIILDLVYKQIITNSNVNMLYLFIGYLIIPVMDFIDYTEKFIENVSSTKNKKQLRMTFFYREYLPIYYDENDKKNYSNLGQMIFDMIGKNFKKKNPVNNKVFKNIKTFLDFQKK